MLIKVNDKNEIVEMALFGGLEDGIDVEGSVQSDFQASFRPGYYLYSNGEIIPNPNYEEPVITDPGPSQTQQQLAQVVYQQMMTTQDVATLQTQNAQMAYQLMMIQQGGEA